MKTINYSRLPKGLTRHLGLNVFEGRKYVYILYRSPYTGQEDRLWVITPERHNKTAAQQYIEYNEPDAISMNV